MLLSMSPQWLTMFFAKVKRRAIAKAFASGNKHCCKQHCYSAAIQAQGYEECLHKNAPRMRMHFLFCLHFVPSLNTWNLNASVRSSSLFCWKILIFPPEACIIYKTTSALQKMEGKAILSDAWARGSTDKSCSITKNELNVKAGDILAECRHLRMETGCSLPCNCCKMFPLHRHGEMEMQLLGRLTFILTTFILTSFIPSNRKHALKIYMLTSSSAKDVCVHLSRISSK